MKAAFLIAVFFAIPAIPSFAEDQELRDRNARVAKLADDLAGKMVQTRNVNAIYNAAEALARELRECEVRWRAPVLPLPHGAYLYSRVLRTVAKKANAISGLTEAARQREYRSDRALEALVRLIEAGQPGTMSPDLIVQTALERGNSEHFLLALSRPAFEKTSSATQQALRNALKNHRSPQSFSFLVAEKEPGKTDSTLGSWMKPPQVTEAVLEESLRLARDIHGKLAELAALKEAGEKSFPGSLIADYAPPANAYPRFAEALKAAGKQREIDAEMEGLLDLVASRFVAFFLASKKAAGAKLATEAHAKLVSDLRKDGTLVELLRKRRDVAVARQDKWLIEGFARLLSEVDGVAVPAPQPRRKSGPGPKPGH